jgi:hypothetical protein
VGQANIPPVPTHLPSYTLFKRSVAALPNTKVLHHVAATFVFVLQEEHPLNAVVIHFQENSCNTELLNILQ